MESDESVPTPNSIHDESPYYITSLYLLFFFFYKNSMEIRNLHFKILSINFPRNSGNKVEDCPCYAGLDEQLFYNAKYEMIPDSYTGKLLEFS